MLDLGALTYSVVCDHFVRKAKLQCINLPRPILLSGVGGTGIIRQAARFTYDIEGWTKTGWAYVAEKVNLGYDLLFGRSWFDLHQVTVAPAKKSIYIHSEHTRIRLRSKEGLATPVMGQGPQVKARPLLA